MSPKSSNHNTALERGVHITTVEIDTRRNGHQWHARLRNMDGASKAALKSGKVVRNVEQGFDVFEAAPRFFNVRYIAAP